MYTPARKFSLINCSEDLIDWYGAVVRSTFDQRVLLMMFSSHMRCWPSCILHIIHVTEHSSQ